MKIPYKLRHLEKYIFSLEKLIFRKKTAERKIREKYLKLYKKDLETKNPIGFREKVFCRIIEINKNGNALFTRLADKYQAREFAESRIGAEYLVPLLWHGKNPAHIPFSSLPPTCIAKTNHGCGGNFVITQETDHKEIIETLRASLESDYYWTDFEYHYHKIKPQVIVEELLVDPKHGAPLDYKFWCFDGTPTLVQVGDNNKTFQSFYSTEWDKLDFKYRPNMASPHIEEPANFETMLNVAKKLSMGFDFVRVDLYNICGKVYFGEMTFTPAAGYFHFTPDHWNETIGQQWRLTPLQK